MMPIVTLDFETYFSKEFTLRKLTKAIHDLQNKKS